MFCPYCGKENAPQARFCRGCGATLQEPAESPTESLSEQQFRAGSSSNESMNNVCSNEEIHGSYAKEQVEIFSGLSTKSWILQMLLSLIFAFFIMLAVINAENKHLRFTDPGVIITILFILCIFVVLVTVLQKALADKVTVSSLIPGVKRRFLLCEEGVYTRSSFPGNIFYRLHPWGSLTLYAINENRGIIALKNGNKLIKLKASYNNYFDDMKNIVLTRLPVGRRTVPENRDMFRWSVVIAAFCVLVVAYVGISSHFENISIGKVGDGSCDIRMCGIRLPIIDVLGDNGTTIHEYCFIHLSEYALIHPGEVVIKTTLSYVSAASKAKWLKEPINRVSLLLSILVIIFWGIIILCISILTPWCKWCRTPSLKQ